MVASSLLALPPREAEARFVELGGKPFHARIARREVFERGVLDYDAMTGLPAGLRETLARELPILRGEVIERREAPDGARKLLLRFPARDERARPAVVETVWIPSRRRDRGATLCVSTQVGCPVGCPFCASGQAGLERNLDAGEILEQYLVGRGEGPLSRSVVMGIGEPLLNWRNLETAVRAVHDDLGLGARRLTVSTVGFPERLDAIGPTRPPFQLAISLHSADDEQRALLVPAMRDVPVEDVLAAGDRWFEATGREVTYEVVLLGGYNDTPHHARLIAQRLGGRRATVNLIPYNPIDEGDWTRPDADAVESFRAALERAGLVATVRWSRGVEGDAACGQLRHRRQTLEAEPSPERESQREQ